MGEYSRQAAFMAVVPAFFAFAAPAGATSFYLNEQSIKAAGRAFSGEVADQGPESLWWNPAAIAGATHGSAAIGAAAILPHANVRDVATQIIRPGGQPSAPVGGDGRPSNPAKSGVLPSGSVAVPLSDRITLGLALSSPFSLTTDYESNSWTRYIADKTKLITIDVQPSVGILLTDNIRVGGALNMEYSKATLQKELPNVLAALPDGSQQLKGHALDFGWSAGAQFVTDRFTLGVSYKSAIKHTYHGSLTISGLLGPLAAGNAAFHTHASFTTPWQAMAGVRFKATDTVTLNLQAVRFGWNKFDQIRLTVPAGAFVPEDYRNSWMVAGGIDWDVTPDWTFRSGVYRDQTPTQDMRRDPNVPDANRTTFAAGTSHRFSRSVTLDLAAEYIHFGSSSIDRQSVSAGSQILTNGRLTSAHALVFGAGARFNF